jgi:transposase-like protein
MPLFEIVGFTCTGHNFNIAFAFMARENTTHYEWVLGELKWLYKCVGTMPIAVVTDREQALIKALGREFPKTHHLLCWVHIKNNCIAQGRALGMTEERARDFARQCIGVFYSRSEATFHLRLQGVRVSWKDGLYNYLCDTWLNPYKECIVRAWTDSRLHLFTTSTNR